MKNRINFLPLVVFLCMTLAFGYLEANAQVNFTNSEAQFDFDNPGLPIQDFQAANVAPGIFVECNVPVNENSNGPCFTPGDILPGIEFTDNPGLDNEGLDVAGANLLGNNNPPNVLLNDRFEENLDVVFTEVTDAVGLTLGCLADDDDDDANCTNQTIIVSVFGPADILLGSTNVPATSFVNTFVGIESGQPITRISLAFSAPSDIEVKAIFDVRFGIRGIPSVPTLSQWGLIVMAGILGIVGFMVMRRRKITA